MSAAAADAPAPLRLPAILQNPHNTSLRQVEAYSAQQREKALARRVARQQPRDTGDHSGRGKRVVRRLDNAQFVGNPHVVAPKRSDYYPSVPLHPRPQRAAFPPSSISRSVPIPPADPPERDPLSTSSQHGAFSTSLKGTRALLRKRSGGGRRTEELVARVEASLRGWLDGEGMLGEEDSHDGRQWSVVDAAWVNLKQGPGGSVGDQADEAGPSTLPQADRRMPARHQVNEEVPALPHRNEGGNSQIPAVLEYSRSPAHLTWAVADSFDRLVVHLVARYYELNSWSEEAAVEGGGAVRLTHIVRPALTRPQTANPLTLLTPETSDASDLSSESERSDASSALQPDSDRGFLTDGDETEAETERGSVFGGDDVDGLKGHREYSLDSMSDMEDYSDDVGRRERTVTPGLSQPFEELHLPSDSSDSGVLLHRTVSNSSSAYASSEGGASDYSALGESMVFPVPTSALGGGGGDISESWVAVRPAARAGAGLPRLDASMPRGFIGRTGWEDKPSFLEYLYGS